MTYPAQTSAKFDLAFAATARHFKLSKEARAPALRCALADYGRACRCYRAIARSLRT